MFTSIIFSGKKANTIKAKYFYYLNGNLVCNLTVSNFKSNYIIDIVNVLVLNLGLKQFLKTATYKTSKKFLVKVTKLKYVIVKFSTII